MTLRATHWVLWISLLLLIPLPVIGQPWGLLPAAYLLLQGLRDSDVVALGHGVVWGGVLWGAVRAYCHLTAAWPPRIRGSIMALFVLTVLMLFSSVPVYRLPDSPDAALLRFQWLYE